MITCSQARTLIHIGVVPGTSRKGMPELGFHLASCCECRSWWADFRAEPQVERPGSVDSLDAVPDPRWSPAPSQPAYEAQSAAPGELHESCYPELPDQNDCTDTSVTSIAIPAESLHAEVEPQVVGTARVSYATLLRNPNFRMLWAGQAISTFGSYFTRVALPIYVFSLTNSYTHLGFAAFSSLVASLMFGLIAGALVDRWDRRRTMIGVELASSAVLVVLFVIVLLPTSSLIKISGIYAVNFLAALLRELFNPARVAILADVVTEEELLAANALDQATTTFGELLSYPLAAAALFLLGPVIAFGIDAATFFLSAILIWRVSIKSRAVRAVERHAGNRFSIWPDITEGIATTIQLPLVRYIVILSLIVPMLLSLMNTLQLPYVVDVLASTQEVGYPLLEGVMAFGFMLGVLALGRWGQSLSRTMLLSYGICTLGLAILAQGALPGISGYLPATTAMRTTWTPLFFVAIPCVFAIGATNSLIFTSIRTVLQEETPREALGRVASVVSVASSIGFAIGALFTGLGEGRAAVVLVLIGAALIVIGLTCRWWFMQYEQRAGSIEAFLSV